MQFARRAGEEIGQFHRRLTNGEADGLGSEIPRTDTPTLAMMYQGDVDLPEGSTSYALFRERVTPSLSANWRMISDTTYWG